MNDSIRSKIAIHRFCQIIDISLTSFLDELLSFWLVLCPPSKYNCPSFLVVLVWVNRGKKKYCYRWLNSYSPQIPYRYSMTFHIFMLSNLPLLLLLDHLRKDFFIAISALSYKLSNKYEYYYSEIVPLSQDSQQWEKVKSTKWRNVGKSAFE